MSKNGSKSAAPAAVKSSTEQTVIPGTEEKKGDKPHPNSTRDNSFLKWRARTITSVTHLGEKYPEIIKEVNAVLAKLRGLPEDYTPYETSIALKVGDVVRLPEHDSMLKELKVENKGEVTEVKRGSAVVTVGKHRFTVLSRSVEILKRA